ILDPYVAGDGLDGDVAAGLLKRDVTGCGLHLRDSVRLREREVAARRLDVDVARDGVEAHIAGRRLHLGGPQTSSAANVRGLRPDNDIRAGRGGYAQAQVRALAEADEESASAADFHPHLVARAAGARVDSRHVDEVLDVAAASLEVDVRLRRGLVRVDVHSAERQLEVET